VATRLFPPAEPDVLYLVDLSGYVFRAYHAITPLSSPTGEPTHAVFGTVNMLERLIRDRRPALLAVAMDSRSETFRTELYPAYKTNRPPAPEDLKQQMVRVAEIVEASAIVVLQQDGVEADDLIATAVAQARLRGLRTVIVTADKDLMQLVGDDVLLWDTMRDRVVGPAEVQERFGVQVAQVRDLLALMGDSSDNIPGVPSVGPKTARDLLQQFGTLDAVFENLNQIKRQKLQQTLRDNRDSARLSQRLVTLKDDCHIDFDLEQLRFGGRNLPRLRAIYTELGFFRLLKALDGEIGEAESAVEAPAEPEVDITPAAPGYAAVLTRTELEAVAARARTAGRLALSVQTCTPDRHRPTLAGLALACGPRAAWYVPVGHRYMGAPRQLPLDTVSELLRPMLADPSVAKVGYDLKRLQLVLRYHGIELQGAAFDCLLASYLLDPEARHSLAHLAERELAEPISTYDAVTRVGRQRRDFDEVPLEEATPHAALEAGVAWRLQESLTRKLAEGRLLGLLEQVELPLCSVLADMEAHGVLVDTGLLEKLGHRVDESLQRIEAEAFRHAGRRFNLNSPRQLETLLFDELRLRPLKRTKTSRSTDASTLEALAAQHPLPQVVLEHRRLAKLKGTYIDALPALVDPRTGRIHTSWQQAVTATGRLSSADPNLQNIPIRTDLGRCIREAFVAPADCQLVSADYSQVELRVLAHLSQDPVLLDAFRSNQDVHARTAMEVFDVPLEQVTQEQRRRAKAINFGIIYGQGDSGLAKSAGISRAEASNFIAAYYRRYQGVRRFMLDETLVQAQQSESVRSLLGRRRLVPEIRSANRAKRLAAERIAMNMPIQGTAADLLKLSMLRLASPVTPGTRMVLTVHDELVFEVPNDEVTEAKRRIREIMEQVYELSVPLVVDVGHGPNWNAAH
jgi:DNA polymerase-1